MELYQENYIKTWIYQVIQENTDNTLHIIFRHEKLISYMSHEGQTLCTFVLLDYDFLPFKALSLVFSYKCPKNTTNVSFYFIAPFSIFSF